MVFQGLAVRDRKILLPEDFRIKIKRTECGKERKRNKGEVPAQGYFSG